MRAARGKRRVPGAAAFLADLEHQALRLERELLDGVWQPGPYTCFEVHEPKTRRISAAPFRDRVVHQALCAEIGPMLERGLISDCYANRTGFGTHRAIARYEQYRDRFTHVLRCDIYRYFPSIDHEILKRDLRRRVRCSRTLEVLDRVVDGSNPQEPVYRYFPGDDLFSPWERRRGLPIGNLTSQWFANYYLDGFDHFVKERLRAPYLRYVDDFALFSNEPSVLVQWQERIARYLEGRRLQLHPVKTRIQATREPANFLGFVLHPGGRRTLPVENVDRFCGRLRALRQQWRGGSVAAPDVRQRVGAWIAHSLHAQTTGLRHALFHGGWFDPLWEPDGPPVARALRGGSWNNNPQNVRAANRNRNEPVNRNNNIGLRVASTLPVAGAAGSIDPAGVPSSVHGPSG